MSMWATIHASANNIIETDAPLGSIIPFDDSYIDAGVLPTGWVWCDGSIINDNLSPFDGELSPALNGTTDENKRFLIGASGVEGTGTEVGSKSHVHSQVESGRTYYDDDDINGYDENWLEDNSNIPKYYEIKYIMRVR